jgi:DNA-binding response OmpR family regulator
MRDSLAQQRFSVTITDDVDKGYEQLLESRFDLVVMCLSDSTSGLKFIKRIRAKSELGRVLILAIAEWGTGQPTMALTAGADGFEPGPVDRERLIAAVAKLMRPNLTMIARGKRS